MRKNSAVYPVTPQQQGRTAALGEVNEAYYPEPEEVEISRPKTRRVSSPSAHAVAAPHDPWQVATLPDIDDNTPPWRELPLGSKVKSVVLVVVKLALVLGLLYFFVCSLDTLSTSFRLIAGKTTGSVFRNSYINNPIVGLMIGIMVTVLVQSSSTSTSIIVSLVNAQILKVPAAIPMIMGSNVGTSVTNTIVSLTQVGDREVFRRAFAGATVHDMFNWLSVFVLISIEIICGMLERLTKAIVDTMDLTQNSGAKKGEEPKLLKVVTEPLTKRIVQIDKNVLEAWAKNSTAYSNSSLIKAVCKEECAVATLPGCKEGKMRVPCDFVFYGTSLSDTVVGLILLLGSLFVLCVALLLIVKLLSSMMKGNMARVIRVTLNADIPYMPWLTGYIALLVGALLTVLVQSSSIFTSTLTPLIGLGLISVDRSYPLTLGSNIGTTTTALLAAISGDSSGLAASIQIALVHLFFNVIGILIFYPIPFMRWPLPLCKGLGNITAKYRWFAVFYLIFTFVLLPCFVFLLSLGGYVVLYCVGGPLLVLIILVVIINLVQNHKPNFLPKVLRNWNFLPKPLRSLEPYDRLFTRLPCCKSCREQETSLPSTVLAVNPSDTNDLKSANGDVLVEPRMFHSVGPVSNPAAKSDEKPEIPISSQFDGVVNRGLEVERL